MTRCLFWAIGLAACKKPAEEPTPGGSTDATTPPPVTTATGDTAAPVPQPVLGSTQIGVGVHQDPAWIQQYGLDRNEETFAIYTGPEGTFIGGTTQSSWFRTFLDPCLDFEHAVARDCGDAILFETNTGVGIQTGGLASDEVRGLVVVDGEVTFGGRTRTAETQVMGAFVTRYLTDLTTLVWDIDLPHSEMLGVAMDRGKTYTVGGTLYDWTPPELNAGSEDALAVKLGYTGLVEAAQQIGSTEFDELHDVRVDERGVYISGITTGVLGPVTNGDEDAILLVWPHTLDDAAEICRVQIGGPRRDGAEAVIPYGDYIYIAGNTEARINGEYPNGSLCYHGDADYLPDAWVGKYDRDCKMIWTRQFGTLLGDAVEGIAVDDQFVYLTGYASAATDHDDAPRADTNDAFLRLYTHEGELAGEVIFDGSLGPDDLRTDYSRALTVDATTVYVGGATDGDMGSTPNAGGRDIFLASVPIAEVAWNVTYDGDGCPVESTP